MRTDHVIRLCYRLPVVGAAENQFHRPAACTHQEISGNAALIAPEMGFEINRHVAEIRNVIHTLARECNGLSVFLPARGSRTNVRHYMGNAHTQHVSQRET
jgi:hypothetical protein